jgi:hypothetical protein
LSKCKALKIKIVSIASKGFLASASFEAKASEF